MKPEVKTNRIKSTLRSKNISYSISYKKSKALAFAKKTISTQIPRKMSFFPEMSES